MKYICMEREDFKDVIIQAILLTVIIGLVFKFNSILQWITCLILAIMGVYIIKIVAAAILMYLFYRWYKKHEDEVKQRVRKVLYIILHPFKYFKKNQ